MVVKERDGEKESVAKVNRNYKRAVHSDRMYKMSMDLSQRRYPVII